MNATNATIGFALPDHGRPVPWWGDVGRVLDAEDAVDRFDRPLAALVEAIRHAHDIGERPDLAAARRRLARIEARLIEQLQGLDAAFDSRAQTALDMARGKARATREWLAAMADAMQPAPVLAEVVATPKRRAGAR